MTYVMNRSLYKNLARALSSDKKRPAPKKVVLKYINQEFGIKGKVTDLTLE